MFPFLSAILALGISVNASARLMEAGRHSLIVWSVEGYNDYKDIRTYLDVGVGAVMTDKGMACEILPPQTPKAAAQPWAPFDFYTNVRTKHEQASHEKEGRLGEPGIFFEGDDNNRNAGADSHRWTRIVTDSFRGSLDFRFQKDPNRPQPKDQFTVFLFFKRTLERQALIEVRAEMEDGHCKALTYLCTDSYTEGEKVFCRPNAWNKRLHAVIAKANLTGASADWWNKVTDEKKKTDVSEVFGLFQDLDKQGNPLNEPHREPILK